MQTVTVKTFGKVNLGLDVTGRRENGYHDVKMVMQTVNLYDIVTVSAEAAPVCSIRITCDEPSVPSDSRNLAYKAAERMVKTFLDGAKISIHIEKHIPVQAGMAGGSADAAAVITALDQLFDLRLDMARKDQIAVSLGADVPFCLRKGTYLSEGIGEVLTRIPDFPHCHMVLVKPDTGVSTAWAYQALDDYLLQCKDPGRIHPEIDQLVAAISDGRFADIAQHMGNILELVVIPAYPVIRELKEQLIRDGAVQALMSGSGPTVFGIFTDRAKAETAFAHLGSDNKYGKFKIEL